MKLLTKEEISNRFDKFFKKIEHNTKSSIQILVESEKLDFHYNYSSDEFNQPFHIASIGKVFTATLIQILADKNKLSLQDPISKFLSNSELDRLFVFQNTDYSKEVTVEQLLTHSSGVGDYFADRVNFGKTISKRIVSEPNKKWTPNQLVDFTRERQQAVGAPGKIFHYSDTGYILLGLIIEAVSGKKFHENLHDEIFVPLKMNDSYLMFYSKPKNTIKPIQKVWLNGKDVTNFASLSVDWSAGGIISTPRDLLAFAKGLRSGRLYSTQRLKIMETCNKKFRSGIYYGIGIMEIRFEEFFFLLKNLPRVKGHIGILSSHMFYDPDTESYIIMNFGSSKLMVKSFKALIEIVTRMKRMK